MLLSIFVWFVFLLLEAVLTANAKGDKQTNQFTLF
jgi:hypothetical protein